MELNKEISVACFRCLRSTCRVREFSKHKDKERNFKSLEVQRAVKNVKGKHISNDTKITKHLPLSTSDIYDKFYLQKTSIKCTYSQSKMANKFLANQRRKVAIGNCFLECANDIKG